MNWYLSVLLKYADFSGRARRKEYWMFVLGNFVISFIISLIQIVLMNNSKALLNIYTLAIIVPSIAVGVRRMHDIGYNGWFILIPIYNLFLLVCEGNKGANEYGADPKLILDSAQGNELKGPAPIQPAVPIPTEDRIGNKRSKGVTFWGWAFIITGILGVLGAINPRLIERYGTTFTSINIIVCLVSVICGIFILRLNETARQAVILLGIFSIIFSAIAFQLKLNSINNHYWGSEYDYIQQKRQQIIDEVKPELREMKLAELEKFKEAAAPIMPVFLFLFSVVPVLIFQGAQIYFFTRPTVKEQFK
jgi:uncharacterized membrane protein YhaH (DUF805 family)